jgi:hypothetical protein
MRAALAGESTPAAKMKLYGMRFEPYVPKLFLGIAAYKRGDCAAALTNLDDPATRAATTTGEESNFSGFVAEAFKAMHECRTRVR